MSPEKAREKLLAVYHKTENSVRETARLLSCSPATVSKWSKRTEFKSRSKAPKNPKRTITDKTLNLIKQERIKTNFGRRRLTKWLLDKYSISISENTVKYYLRKFNLSKPCKQRARYKGISYYNWPDLKPLQHFQIDTKEILDSKTLPEDVYRHIINEKLPKYQFTAIDVKTRLKFLTYAYQNTKTNGIAFMKLLISWLRINGVSHQLFLQSDRGNEFGGPSLKSWLKIQKDILEPRFVTFLKIRKARWTDNAYVERTHRTDDEEFYIPKILDISSLSDFFETSWGYVSYFNCQRPHCGKFMNSLAPWQMLYKLSPSLPKTICFMPPVILDTVSSSKLFLTEEHLKWFSSYRGVRDVFDTYYPAFHGELYEVKSIFSQTT